MVNEVSPENPEEDEVSLDDILDTDEEDKKENGSENSDSDDEDEDADEIMHKNGGPADIDTGRQDASQDAKTEEAAVAEGDDVSNALKNFFQDPSFKAPVMKKANSNVSNNNGGLIPLDFFK